MGRRCPPLITHIPLSARICLDSEYDIHPAGVKAKNLPVNQAIGQTTKILKEKCYIYLNFYKWSRTKMI